MAAWFTSIIDGLDPLVQFHRETGLSVEGLQELGRVAELNGSSMEAVTSSIGEMTMRIGEFISTGEGEMADIGKRLGLQFKDASGNVKDATQTFIELSDKMRSMSQAEKVLRPWIKWALIAQWCRCSHLAVKNWINHSNRPVTGEL